MKSEVQTAGAVSKRVELTYNGIDQSTEIVRRTGSLPTDPEVATSKFQFEAGDRLATLTHSRGGTPLATGTYGWQWDKADRIGTMTIGTENTITYSHNNRDELTLATHSDPDIPDESYSFDGAGNRLAHTIDPNNELKFDGTNTYTYDSEGNRLTKLNGAGTTNYTWDHRNRLTRVVTPTVTLDYKYDLFDRRIERAVSGGVTQRFGYDEDAIALEFNDTNTLTHRYLHGPQVDQVFADEKIGTGNYWTLSDHLGTVRDLVNDAGTNLNHIKYDSFGKRVTPEDPDETLYSFTGRERDVETGLYYYRARYYDPAVGTFVSVDPSGFDAGDSNLYRYVNNGPTSATDPSGKQFRALWESAQWDTNQNYARRAGRYLAGRLNVGQAFADAGQYFGNGKKDSGWSTAESKGQYHMVGGTVRWSIRPLGKFGHQVQAAFDFYPNFSNSSGNIAFLQVVTGHWLDNKSVPPPKEMKNFASHIGREWVDLGKNPDAISPFYGATWSLQEKRWVDDPAYGRLGRGPLAGQGPAQKAHMLDVTNPDFATVRKGKENLVLFETAVFSIDTQEVLGSFHWGYYVPQDRTTPTSVIGPAFTDKVTDQFKWAIARWNVFSKKGIGIRAPEGPDRLGGTSAYIDHIPLLINSGMIKFPR